MSVDGRKGSVDIVGVTKTFGSVVAVDAIDLHVAPGEFIALLGPSGCGKTTTLRMLAGFDDPDAGSIRISGQDVLGRPPYKRDVNTVFQHYALFPHMTVAENVAYGLRQKRVAKAEIGRRVGEALEMVKMSKLARRKPRQMSGGQQQRVALARALVNQPSVLLLDEPLGALDRKLRQEMQIELKLLQRDVGITFVFVTHDQEEALSMSDRIAVMLDGQIEQLADPDTIYEQPSSAFVAGFIGQNNFWSGVATVDGMRAEDGAVFLSERMQDGLVPGAATLGSVRPEAINVSTTDPGASTNCVQGELAGVSPLGDIVQFVVRTAEREVLIRAPRRDAARALPGDPVWCTWSARDAYVFDARQRDLVLVDPTTDTAPVGA
jgi:spermidine/putrescine ABC transporter ATP-binding subunit